jgi:hypothetical protein
VGRRHCTQCKQWKAPKASSAIATCVTVTVGGHRQPKNHQMRWVKGYYTVPSHTVWNVNRVNGPMVDWEGHHVTPPAGTILRCNQTAGTSTSASIVESEAGRVIKRRICALRRLALSVRVESADRDRFASLPGWLFTSVSMIQDTVSAGRGGDVVIGRTDCLIGGGWPRIL